MRTTVQPYSKSCAKIIMNVTAAPLIGQPVDRAEDLRFLTGAGKFVDDLTRDGILHAVVLRSGVAHGRIKRLDTSAARARPGVHAVITAAEIGANVPVIPLRLANLPEFAPYLQPVIASDKVRYVGEPVAVVVAESQALAEDATEAINLEIERLPALPDRHAAASGTALLFEATSSNQAVRYSVAFGDADAAFAKAEYTRRESFRCHRLTAVPLETRGLIAEWDSTKGKPTVFGATKVLFFNRRVLAPMLGLAENAIDMIEPDVGGGFGVRGEFYPEDFLIPFAARHVRRPVKWIEDRREHLMATNHSREVDCDLEIACTRDGVILGLRGHIYGDMGAYIRTNGGVVPAKAAQFLPGPYRIRDVAITVEALMTSKTPVGTVRAPGRFEANFFRERLLDIVARDLGLDPMEFRRKNLISEPELPFATGKLVPYEGETEFDTGDYHATFQRALSEIGWPEKKSLQSRLIDGRYQVAVRARAYPAWLNYLCARGFRHLRIPVHGSGRLGGDGWLQQSHRCYPCRGNRTLRPSQRGDCYRERRGERRGKTRGSRGVCRYRGGRQLRDHDSHLQLRRARLPRCGRPAHRTRRNSRLRRYRGCRPRHQSAYCPWPGHRGLGPRAGRCVPRPSHL